MNALLPVICAIAGALVYALAPPKFAELGRLAFMAAIFALMFSLASRSVHLF